MKDKSFFNEFIAKRKDESGLDPRIVSYYAPGTALTEQYRSIRTYLNSLDGGKMWRSVMVSSANREEGRTLTSVNLAVTMAEEKEKRVVLVNTDFRYPAIEKLLNIQEGQGLSNYLNDEVPLDKILINTAVNNLTVLPLGTALSNPAELMASSKMKDLIKELEKKFNYVILDTPAFIPFADAHSLGSLVDGVLLVVQASKTRREVVWRMQEQLMGVRARLLGVILTHVEYHIPEYIHRHL
ncbi:MAG: CpsD/CapB family tyrosine-protein kinase [PVC group bacterium]|nr:CpsD/CapB family tyrosine-protein kinase [PVC group bacterium]